MKYEFRCLEHGVFEVEQPIESEHSATCPRCGEPAQRVFTPLDRVVREAVKSSWRKQWI